MQCEPECSMFNTYEKLLIVFPVYGLAFVFSQITDFIMFLIWKNIHKH